MLRKYSDLGVFPRNSSTSSATTLGTVTLNVIFKSSIAMFARLSFVLKHLLNFFKNYAKTNYRES